MKNFVFGIGTAQEGNNYFKLFYESGSINSYEPGRVTKIDSPPTGLGSGDGYTVNINFELQ